MFEFEPITHRIQKYILGYLMENEFARFSAMRPPKTDTNLYSYHLKLLLKQGYVVKTDKEYTLGPKGAVYVDRVSTNTVKLRPQPKIITMLVIQDEEGNVLMFKKRRQPFIGLWTLPYGKVHNSDTTIFEAAQREIDEKLDGLKVDDLRHAGDTYVHVKAQDEIAISTLIHIFYATTTRSEVEDYLSWENPLKISQENSAPGIVEVLQFALISKMYFFEEVTTDWR